MNLIKINYKCNKLPTIKVIKFNLTIKVIIWLNINVINVNHKYNKYRNSYQSELVSRHENE